ncbi:MAG: TetR/AcrR family transcriptional regulator [Clostridiales bacterium]|jgi:AcrR family transcriptional regulator|nr:TetR/AcrR family transcriptional regulator [Clostridiales bacterium]MDR2750753.1 TetR/AcrR family transcriptional regulator [Clostridiales bacterium]
MPTRTFKRLDEEKQERVLRSAIREFHECGFEKAKMEVIAQNAEVAKGSMYQYFSDKKELFLYCASWTLEYFMKDIDTQTPLKNIDIFDYFLSGVRGQIELIKREPLLLMFMQDLTSGKFGELTKESMDGLWRIGDEYMLELVSTGKKKGTIRDDVDDFLLVLFVKGATSKINEHLFKEAEKCGFNMDDLQYAKIEESLNRMVLLLKQGMGR